MTINELSTAVAKDISRELKTRINKKVVKLILRDTLRVMLEELVANPDKAVIKIPQIGKFYVTTWKYDGTIVPPWLRKEGVTHLKPKEVKHILFKRYRNAGLDQVLNGQQRLDELFLDAFTPLYPDSETAKNSAMVRKNPITFTVSYTKKKKRNNTKTSRLKKMNLEGRIPEDK